MGERYLHRGERRGEGHYARRMPLSSPLGRYYDARFFEAQAVASRASARVVLDEVTSLLSPRSVLDVGCGVGPWLAEWQNRGVTDVLGVDGDYVDRAKLQIPLSKFVAKDLSHEFHLGRRFDLIQCLEVAEHLPEGSAAALVDSLTAHGDVVLFSAAVPGQGGTHHVNERWPSYWSALFRSRGYEAHDVLRPRLWADERVDVWYRQNMLLFAKPHAFASTCIDGQQTMGALDVVHPQIFAESVRAAEIPRRMMRLVPGGLRAALRQLRVSR